MVLPETLPSLGGSWGPFEYKETIGTYHYYSSSWDTYSPPQHGTKVQSDSSASDYDVWSDSHSGHDPSQFILNADGTVSLFNNSNALLFKFLKPTEADWIPVSPPPNTNSVSDFFVSYVVEDNELRVYIPLDKPSTFYHLNPDPPNRHLYYQLRNVSVSVGQTISLIVHTQGTPTNQTIVPTTAGIYQLEKVQTNPTEYTIYDTAEVTQAQLDVYAANNAPENFRGSGRRGNLNFW